MLMLKVKKELQKAIEDLLEQETEGRGEWRLGPNDEGQVYVSKGEISVVEYDELGHKIEHRFRIELVPIL